ncbi:hypothetical protein PRK78_006513 [Emydomyces testavorans]|uniref:Translation initiation factor eIF2B subunit delta n=1 Tax=Emydomyces testavorans TaxID=2070801 RepID=A0AAF0DMJ1_9EURO|nr:hypothetical protein PRK78_006513 [Emydomyces testavorans]
MAESVKKRGIGSRVVEVSRRCWRWQRKKKMKKLWAIFFFRKSPPPPPPPPHVTHQPDLINNKTTTITAKKKKNANGREIDKALFHCTDLIMSASLDNTANSSAPSSELAQQQLNTSESSTAHASSAAMNGGVEKKEKEAVDTKQAAEKKGQVESAPKLSNAELKKKAKADKAARRAREKQEREDQQQGGRDTVSAQTQASQQQAGGAKKGGGGGGGGGAGKQDAKQPQKKGENAAKGQRQGGTTTVKQAAGQRGGSIHVPAAEVKRKKKTENENIVAVFGHLPWHSRRAGITGVGKEIHPAVVALGMQLRDYVICGSSARSVATLLALRRVVQAYITPVGTSLSRHLTTYLSHQINYLTTCRPLSISQGNAIRALKLEITTIDPGDSEDEAKQRIYDYIDSYIREKYTVASQVIANSAAEKIKDGDVILCYASSSVVQKALLTAHVQGKKFRVSIIDTRPLFEGKNLARTLSKAGVEVQYSLINGITYAIREATKVFLGAHAMTSNGCLFSRVGTALVAMSAKERAGGINVPVIVCCETAKFTDRVALDSIVVNEIADADELVAVESSEQVTDLSPPALPVPPSKGKFTPVASTGAQNAETSSIASSLGPTSLVTDPNRPLQNWREMKNLQLLNIMHDVTPAQYIDMVITEMGSLPPSAVPIVHRMSTDSEGK